MRVLFVCTGNTCRSPIAEAIGRRIASERQVDIEFASAGTEASDGSPASDAALLVGLERGLDIAAHRSRRLTRELVDAADLVLAMSGHHLVHIKAMGGEGKSHLLMTYASKGAEDHAIADPFGGPLEVYREMANELEAEIARVVDRVEGEFPP